MQPAQRVSSHTKIFHTMLKHNVMLIPLASPGFVMRREGTGVTELQQLLCLNVQCLDRHNQGHSWAWGPEVLTPPPSSDQDHSSEIDANPGRFLEGRGVRDRVRTLFVPKYYYGICVLERHYIYRVGQKTDCFSDLITL